MRKATLFLLVLVITSCSKEVPEDKIVYRDDIAYEVNSINPFEGVVLKYYKDGTLFNKTTFKNGRKNGPSKWYQGNGQLFRSEFYKDGELDGLREIYHANGQLQEKSFYKDNRREGPYEEYYENGQLKEKSFYRDWFDKHGLYEEYYENGQLKEKSFYKDNRREGFHEEYYSNGQLKFKGDLETLGRHENFFPNGQIEAIWDFSEDRDVFEFYLIDGTISERWIQTYGQTKSEYTEVQCYFQNPQQDVSPNSVAVSDKSGTTIIEGSPDENPICTVDE